MELNEVKNALSMMKNDYVKREGALEVIKDQKAQKEKVVEDFKKDRENLEFEFRLFKTTGEEARKMAAELLCDIANRGASLVFGENKTIRYNLYESGGVPYIEFEIVNAFEDGYEVVSSPTDASGGGVADIVAIAAFSALSHLAQNGNTAPWLMDEPNKYVSAGKDEQSSDFIYRLSHDFDRQIIMVSHRPSSINYSDKTYRIYLDSAGKSQAEDITNYAELDALKEVEANEQGD